MEQLIPHIAIVGAGQLGSRHLQALRKISSDIDISVVEPNSSAMEISKKRYDDVPFNPCIQSVKWLQDISQLSSFVNIAIVATNSDIRRSVVEQLITYPGVGNMILEKVVFQSTADFEKMIALIERLQINVWVNCTRRMYPVYKEIWTTLMKEDKINFRIEGNNWGLGCNSIHHLDLFAYLTGDNKIKLDCSGLDKKIYQSKRAGFVEFGGCLTGQSSRGDFVELIDNVDDNGIKLTLRIQSDKIDVTVNEIDGFALFTEYEGGGQERKVNITIPRQSELTHLAVKQILDEGTCDLPEIQESYLIHKPMLEAFNHHLESIMNKSYKKCPIT